MRKKQGSFLKQKYHLLFIAINLLIIVQCSSKELDKNQVTANNKMEVQKEVKDTSHFDIPEINYHLISTKDSNRLLKTMQSGDTIKALLALNRIGFSNLFNLDTLVFPDTFGIGIGMYSPFPKNIAALRDVHKIVLISYYAQAFGIYENGIRMRWGPASLGKKTTPTPTGLFATNWKSRKTVSTVNSSWVMEWYFNIANFRGVSIHQYELPGYPASHACIRLNKKDARWLYNWADQWKLDGRNISVYGTAVIIYGSYPYGKRKPWWILAEDNMIFDIDSVEQTAAIQEFLPIILERQEKRDSLVIDN